MDSRLQQCDGVELIVSNPQSIHIVILSEYNIMYFSPCLKAEYVSESTHHSCDHRDFALHPKWSTKTQGFRHKEGKLQSFSSPCEGFCMDSAITAFNKRTVSTALYHRSLLFHIKWWTPSPKIADGASRSLRRSLWQGWAAQKQRMMDSAVTAGKERTQCGGGNINWTVPSGNRSAFCYRRNFWQYGILLASAILQLNKYEQNTRRSL